LQRIAGLAPKEMKIICIGRNYTEHIAELQNERPSEPVVFLKPDSAVLLKQHPFVIPEFSNDIHHEVEVLVKINKVGKYIDAKFAHKYYDEIGLGIDFTARDLQSQLKEKGLPWEKAKAFDGSAVIGDFLSKKIFNSLENLTFELTNNGETVQKGNTNMMLWKIDELIAYVSQYFTLKIGDIIFTGTPAGVARVNPNDILEGFLEENKLFRIQVK
jgi:2-keto-4-pentenoate hydratase/2-oxohepta-3-ene-1,7-dioic acid hydratase in catechol pathway